MGGTARYRDTCEDGGTGEAVVRGDARKVVPSKDGCPSPCPDADASPCPGPCPNPVIEPLLRPCRSGGEHTYSLSLPA